MKGIEEILPNMKTLDLQDLNISDTIFSTRNKQSRNGISHNLQSKVLSNQDLNNTHIFKRNHFSNLKSSLQNNALDMFSARGTRR